jgi:hypothetical protein
MGKGTHFMFYKVRLAALDIYNFTWLHLIDSFVLHPIGEKNGMKLIKVITLWEPSDL